MTNIPFDDRTWFEERKRNAVSVARYNELAGKEGLSPKQMSDVFTAVFDFTIFFPHPNVTVKQAICALENMIISGKVTHENLVMQLGAGIPDILHIVEDAMGIPARKLNTILKEEKLPAHKFLPKLAKKLQKHTKRENKYHRRRVQMEDLKRRYEILIKRMALFCRY